MNSFYEFNRLTETDRNIDSVEISDSFEQNVTMNK